MPEVRTTSRTALHPEVGGLTRFDGRSRV